MNRDQMRRLAKERVDVRLGFKDEVEYDPADENEDLTAWAVVILMCVSMASIMAALSAWGVC